MGVMQRSRKRNGMAQEIKSAWVGQCWGKDARKMRRIDRARRAAAARREIESA